jgi:nitrate/TMAO reductase-like tetraheme cytochrome c subunit
MAIHNQKFDNIQVEDAQAIYERFKEKYEECIKLHNIRHLDYYNDMMNWCVRQGAVDHE